MSLSTIIKQALSTLACTAAIGCSSAEKKDYPLWMLPINAAAGYFGSMATHEASHALTAKLAGAKHITIDIVPQKYNGDFHLGYAEYNGNLAEKETTLFNVSGPMSQFTANIATRELLKTGYVPNAAQPTLAWFALANKLLVYDEAIGGIVRDKKRDLGKEHIAMSLGFLAAELAYDVYDFSVDVDDDFFKVLIGDKFYESQNTTLSLEQVGDGVGLFFKAKF